MNVICTTKNKNVTVVSKAQKVSYYSLWSKKEYNRNVKKKNNFLGSEQPIDTEQL